MLHHSTTIVAEPQYANAADSDQVSFTLTAKSIALTENDATYQLHGATPVRTLLLPIISPFLTDKHEA